MKKFLTDKNVRLRCKKYYPEAHTHVIIGRVVEETMNYIVIKGRTFHFGSIIDMRSQICCGENMVRIVPWENVEVLHWISEKADWNTDITFDQNGNLILADKAHTVIATRRDG